MRTMYRVTIAAAAIGIAALSLTGSANAGNGSAVGAGLLGFGVGAVVGSALAPQTVYVAPPRRSITRHLHRFTSRRQSTSRQRPFTLDRRITGVRIEVIDASDLQPLVGVLE